MRNDPRRCAGFVLSAALAAATLTGCVRHAHSTTQVVAKVNGGEVTVSQLNQSLDTLGPETLTPAVTKRAIDSLVDEELLVQAALQNKIDRDPATVAAIEHARRQILAEAYAERVLYPKAPVTLADEEKYYKENPGLFENRRFYRLTVYAIRQSDMSDLLNADLNNTHSADQVREVLEKHQIKYETQHLGSPAEDLPLEKVPQFAAANVGDLLIGNRADGQVLLISVTGMEPQPLSFESAKPAIDQYLTKKRNNDAIQEHLRMEKSTARITYIGQFAQYAAQAHN